MSNQGNSVSGNLQFRLTLLFLFLGTGLTALVSGYWFMALEPRLLADATTSAGALAQSQARNLANALAKAIETRDPTLVQDVMDEILVLTDPGTELPFVVHLEVKVDYQMVDAPEGTFDLRRGASCDQCFLAEIPLYAPAGGELLGVAVFHSSNAFFRQLREGVRSRLLLVGTGALALWLLSWWAVSGLFRAVRASERAASHAMAQERGATVERERIARDLHDDVAPQLLTLAHTADKPQNAERARAALQTLRESIYALSDPRDLPLEAVLAQWRIEVAERAEAAGIGWSWHAPADVPEVSLASRQRLNLGRVLREAVTNALRHAAPSHLKVDIEATPERLLVHLANNGRVTRPETWSAGKGLSNMRTRIRELGGQIVWRAISEPFAGIEVSWETPLFSSCVPPVKNA